MPCSVAGPRLDLGHLPPSLLSRPRRAELTARPADPTGIETGPHALKTTVAAGIILEYEQADELRNKSIDLLNLSAE